MKLILITTPTYFVEEDKILTTLFDEGLDILHLRNPTLRRSMRNVCLRSFLKNITNESSFMGISI